MSRFFVGQRVRLVRPTNPINMGIEGRFERYADTPRGTRMSNGCTEIEGKCFVHYRGDPAGSVEHTDRLEPILPEGHKPCEEQFKRDLDRLLERDGVSA